MSQIRNALAGLRMLGRLDRRERAALLALAATVGEEHVAALQSPDVDPDATISSLASLRFTERVSIGKRANIGPYCCIWGGWSTAWARVEDGALLSPGVVLVAGQHRIAEPGWVRDLGFDEHDVVIGEGAWIGAHAAVLGCRVGTGAVVGAGAVVTNDVPDNAIAVGVPARVVGARPGG